ncbi:hypothetical protein HJ01_03559 [Flavobacterium frigoris PS1]|uniref:Uncharacterized protein n=1 Tax=Flavobacterium frigoris (strain PS1) TaxID=1086011 RepID=H7FWL5_FLAFP|nr:hypothetical protein HJ01_03559 [Flavobacterium frigoris PS1]
MKIFRLDLLFLLYQGKRKEPLQGKKHLKLKGGLPVAVS